MLYGGQHPYALAGGSAEAKGKGSVHMWPTGQATVVGAHEVCCMNQISEEKSLRYSNWNSFCKTSEISQGVSLKCHRMLGAWCMQGWCLYNLRVSPWHLLACCKAFWDALPCCFLSAPTNTHDPTSVGLSLSDGRPPKPLTDTALPLAHICKG